MTIPRNGWVKVSLAATFFAVAMMFAGVMMTIEEHRAAAIVSAETPFP